MPRCEGSRDEAAAAGGRDARDREAYPLRAFLRSLGMEKGPWLAGDSSPLRSRPSPARCRFRSRTGRRFAAIPIPRSTGHRHPGGHSLRSRHSRAAASPPASLPSLTVPLRVRLGRAPCRSGRIDPLGARPLPERPPGRRPHSAPPSCGCYAPYRGPKAQRGVPRSGLWSEEWESPRSGVRYASGTGSERAKVASVAERNPPRALGPSVAGSRRKESPSYLKFSFPISV